LVMRQPSTPLVKLGRLLLNSRNCDCRGHSDVLLPEQEQRELFMRGSPRPKSMQNDSRVSRNASSRSGHARRIALHCVRAGALAVLLPGLLSGCAYWHSHHGMDAGPVASNSPSSAPAHEIAAPAPPGIVQTSGPDSTGMVVTPLDLPKDTSPKFPASRSVPAAPIELPRMTNAPGPAAFPNASVTGVNTPRAESGSTVNSHEKLRELAQAATARYASIDSYIARFRRREVVAGKQKPEEMMLIKFRKEPWSVYFKWLGTEGTGREAIYVAGKYEDKLHTLLAAGDMPLMPAGKRIALSPDSSLVRNASRHSVRDAGVGTLIKQFAELASANSRGDFRLGSLRYLGKIRRAEFDQPCEAAEQLISPGEDPGLARGGKRLWVFDSVSNLPILVEAWDETNREVEYYCYDRLEYPAHLTDDDFNPDLLWKPKSKR
jgi:hypothetical protein